MNKISFKQLIWTVSRVFINFHKEVPFDSMSRFHIENEYYKSSILVYLKKENYFYVTIHFYWNQQIPNSTI